MTKVKKTVLFIGGGDYLKCFLKSFNSKKVFKNTHILFIKKYDFDCSEIDKCDLTSLAAQKKVNLIECSLPLVDKLAGIIDKNGIDLVMVFGCTEILPPKLLNIRGVDWVNFHPTPLPEFRGVANDSWAFIQNKQQKIGAVLHKIVPKLDQGEIYVSLTEEMLHDPKTVLERKTYLLKFLKEKFFPICIEWLTNNYFTGILQNDNAAFYGPSLRAKFNGFIDFSWTAKEIVSFIRAFSNPYSGACFRYSENPNILYYASEAKVIYNDYYHPFCRGLIQGSNEGKLSVCTSGCLVELSNIYPDMNFRLGSRVFNTASELQESLLKRV